MKLAVATWRSIDRKLPLLITVVLLATLAAFTVSAYHLVQRVLLTAAGERLQGASAPLALSLAGSARQHRTLLAGIARDPAIGDFLATGRGPGAARRALARAWGSTSAPRGRLELRDATGKVVLDTIGAPTPAGSGWADSVIGSGGAQPGEALIAPFVHEGETVFGRSLIAVPGPGTGASAPSGGDDERSVFGYIYDIRPISGQGVQDIRDLLGEGAALLVGSTDGGVWTDLEHVAPAPPAGVKPGAPLVYASSARGAGVGAATAIAGTPWMLWVEQPRAAVLAPMNSLFRQLGTLAALFILAGAAGAWALSRRFTRPIVALAEAADRVVPYTEPVTPGTLAPEPHHRDEIARLTDAFTRMAARVDESREELEGRVAERTARLETALRELEVAQQELVKKERLAMLGQLSSAVGHELRNPLGVMTNALYVIDQCLPDAAPLVREYLDLIRGQIAASERIVGDLLDTARVRTPDATAVDLGELVDAQLRRLGSTGSVTVDQRIGGDLPAVRMDPMQLSQILLNLFTNAVQAMGEGIDGGTLTIEADVAGAGDRVRLTISDTGPGMPSDVLEHIFDPLFTTKARGLGLGLWVSQNLASANGAELQATSRAGEGATFTLDMPVMAAAPVPAA